MLATTVQRPGGEKTIGLVRLALNHDITATPRKVKLDGKGREWKNTDEALFLGELSDAWATIRASQDKDNIYFLVEVADEDITASDYVSLMLADAEAANSDTLVINVSADGLLIADRFGVSVPEVRYAMTSEGKLDDGSDKDKGWIVEIAVPREILNVNDSEIAFNAALHDGAVGCEDFLSEPLEDGSVDNWKRIKGL